jgi:hypothetical protein
MKNYKEIERLFQEVLDEKDRFRISAEATVICNKLKETNFKPKCIGAKERHIDITQDLLNMYSINFNKIIWEKVQAQMHAVLNCIEVLDN